MSLLARFEKASGWQDWVVGQHGIIISFPDPEQRGVRRTATFLPDVAPEQVGLEGGNDTKDAGGINGGRMPRPTVAPSGLCGRGSAWKSDRLWAGGWCGVD